MRKIIGICLLFVVIGIFQVCGAQAIRYAYSIPTGNTVGSTTDARSVAEDANGNVYVCGFFTKSINLDPTGNSQDLHTTTSFSSNPYLIKLDSAGNYVWGRAFIGNSLVDVYDLALDASGNVYMTGSYQGTLDFDPGAGTNNLQASNQDMFLIKINSSGSLVWYNTVGNLQAFVVGNAIAVSGNNVTVGGQMYGPGPTLDFNAHGAIGTNTSYSDEDGFIATYDLNGNFVRVSTIGTNNLGTNGVHNVTYDGSGNLYAVGYFTNAFGI